jgi:pimeloyl-ACP methyl ester carboxylesterase
LTLPDGLFVERRGKGPAVVFSHGFASTSATFSAQLEALAAAGYTVAAWDLRGQGRSAVPAQPYTRDAALTDLHAVVESAGPPALLVGHSLGGYLSLAYALEHPGAVAGLALLSAGPGFRNPERREAFNRGVDIIAKRREITPEAAEVSMHRDSKVIDALGTIAYPTLVVVGADDDELYRGGSNYIAGKIPGARLVEIPGAGHDVHRDRFAEVGAVLVEFAQGLSGLRSP